MAEHRLFRGGLSSGPTSDRSVAVIGLGRFGQSLALELMDEGAEVLGIDVREDTVQALNGRLTHAVVADATQEEVLRQLAIPEFDRVVIAIGSDFAMVKTALSPELAGTRLGDSGIRRRYGVTVTSVKPAGGTWQPATQDTVLQEGDTILVTGPTKQAERSSRVTS